MPARSAATRKITISLPRDLVEFVDRYAEQTRATRGQVIGAALAKLRQAEEERLAMEGYRFYAQEGGEFAVASSQAVAEALDRGS